MPYDNYVVNTHLTNNMQVKRQKEIVNLLIELSCEEFNITRKFFFSGTKKQVCIDAMSVVVYILYNHYEIGMTQLHRLMAERGYPKGRATLYNQLKGARRRIKRKSEFSYVYEYLYQEAMNYLDAEEKVEEDNWRYTMKGRIFTKLNNLESVESLKKVEELMNLELHEKVQREEANQRQETHF